MARFHRDISMIACGVLAGAFSCVMLSAGGQSSPARRAGGDLKAGALAIEVTHARMVALPDVKHPSGAFSSLNGPSVQVDASAPDPEFKRPNDPAVTHILGPYYVIKGEVARINGAPAHGTFVSRGVWFSDDKPPQPEGVAQETISIDVPGRGTLFAEGIMLRSAGPEGVVLGGTGDFEGTSGAYQVEGAVSPYGSGTLTIHCRSGRRAR